MNPSSFLALSDKCAVVTGAGSIGQGIGNGRAAAILLAREGVQVALVDRNAAAAQQTLDIILSEGGRARVFTGDVGAPDDAEALVASVVSAFGGIDILVNNVGVPGPSGDVTSVDLDAWHAGMRTNVESMLLMSCFCVPEMRRRGGGSIVNISSIAGIRGGHPTILYPATKGAIVGMTIAMAAHHGADGIRVNCVAPGLAFTPLVETAGVTEAMRHERRRVAPLPIEGTGWDVGNAIVFLSSQAARWITGIVLPVDGGLSSVANIPTPAAAYAGRATAQDDAAG